MPEDLKPTTAEERMRKQEGDQMNEETTSNERHGSDPYMHIENRVVGVELELEKRLVIEYPWEPVAWPSEIRRGIDVSGAEELEPTTPQWRAERLRFLKDHGLWNLPERRLIRDIERRDDEIAELKSELHLGG